MDFKDISNVMNNLNILYVEDEAVTQNEIKETLLNFSSSITAVSNGHEAYTIFCEQEVDLIISDIEMPKLNGIELVKKIRKDNIAIPIVMVTAYTNNEYLLEFVNLNIQAYIMKPISTLKLKEAFIKVINYLQLDKKQTVQLHSNLIYEKENGLLFHENNEIILNKKEKQLLDLLLLHKNNLVSYDLIEYEIWEKFDELMTSSALRTVIKNLRKKLFYDLIKNVSGFGYKLVF